MTSERPAPRTAPGAYRPGRHRTPGEVQRQLQARRESVRAAWVRDPGREVALLLLFVVCLGTVLLAAVTAKVGTFTALGRSADDTFWMESAQRFRYVGMVADGIEIPALDTRMQAPDGYPPRADTILQEMIYGRLAARFAAPDESLAAFVRRLTRILSASGVVGMALLAYALTRRRDAALLAALLFGLCLPVAERGNGAVLFREDLAYPILLLHLGLLGLWARRPTVLRAAAAGAALLAALLLWKVVTFYALLLVGFVGSALVLGRLSPRDAALGVVALLGPAALGTLLPLNLAHDQFLTSTPMVLGAATLTAALVAWRWSAIEAGGRLAALAVAAVALRLALPSASGYDHAWETILAKLVSFDQKPLDPTELSFHARHYWTGNYMSPDRARLARDWPWLAAVAFPGLVVLIRQLRGAPTAPLRPPPSALLAGNGPLDPLPPLLSWFALWLAGSFVGVYLLFSKLVLFAATALACLAALGFAAPVRFRAARRALFVLVALLVVAHGAGRLPAIGGAPSDGDQEDRWSPVVVFTSASFSELSEWLPTGTHEDEPILASFIISPFLLTYLNRTTLLHCFFEGDLLVRLQEVIEARFGSEEDLWEVSRRYGARWYIHEPHHLLRTDPRMSQRYVAGAMDWPADSVLAQMQYAPERLRRFELAWENDWFRVFRVLGPDEVAAAPALTSAGPIWSRPLFAELFGDPLEPGDHVRAELTPADLLYSTLRAEAWLRYADANRVEGAPLVRFPEQEYGLHEALEVAPYLVVAHDRLAALYTAAGKPERAAESRRAAASVRGVLAGRSRGLEALAPVPVSLGD